MHPTLMHEIARYRQADLLREAEQARLARLATLDADRPRHRFRLRRRTRAALRPALEN